MKSILIITMLLLIPTICFAAATEETGDTRARPVSAYGQQADGTVTAILVDSDGKVQLA